MSQKKNICQTLIMPPLSQPPSNTKTVKLYQIFCNSSFLHMRLPSQSSCQEKLPSKLQHTHKWAPRVCVTSVSCLCSHWNHSENTPWLSGKCPCRGLLVMAVEDTSCGFLFVHCIHTYTHLWMHLDAIAQLPWLLSPLQGLVYSLHVDSL